MHTMDMQPRRVIIVYAALSIPECTEPDLEPHLIITLQDHRVPYIVLYSLSPSPETRRTSFTVSGGEYCSGARDP